MKSYVEQIKNPYMFKVGDTVIAKALNEEGVPTPAQQKNIRKSSSVIEKKNYEPFMNKC